ncbi:MAG: glycosyltransferase involved in cell wall biosynthesis [Chlamydiales bacterium]|jgi:glycosyltransferase involved in cell wall biosynthesis
MRILHTEASPGWGGQEIRILREAEGMRKRGHEVIMAINRGGGLVGPARQAGFEVYELSFEKKKLLFTLFHLLKIIWKHDIDIVNTHSSLDAWTAGIAARLSRKKVIRTRHLSTAIRPGLNSIALYNWLADNVVTTCAAIVETIQLQAKLPPHRCMSIPTGINPESFNVSEDEVLKLRESLGISKDTCLVGTACILRSWKGVSDLLQAAKTLQGRENIKWLIVGGGVSEKYFRDQWKDLGLQKSVIFTGHLDNPYTAIAAMDIFALLSTGNEGVSQASLQAAYLKKPLITTTIGGLPEVCIHGETGYQVGVSSFLEVAESVLLLSENIEDRMIMGERAHKLVMDRFTMNKTLNDMESIYKAALEGNK